MVKCLAVDGRLLAVRHAVIPDHARNPQSIIREQGRPTSDLCSAMCLQVAPRLDSLFVPPERQRKDLARPAQTLESLNRDEPINLIEQGPQIGGDVEINLFARLVR